MGTEALNQATSKVIPQEITQRDIPYPGHLKGYASRDHPERCPSRPLQRLVVLRWGGLFKTVYLVI